MIERADLQDEYGSKWELKYYVQSHAGEKEKTYGIKVERCGKDGMISEETFGVTASYEEAASWVRKMANGKVTPLTLHDVVDNFEEDR